MSNENMTATLKYAIVSDKKMLLVSKLVKGKKVQEALNILGYIPKKSAKILAKVIQSASSNAVVNGKKKLPDLFIEAIEIGKGPKIKRIRFTSRSRVSHYEKSRCYVKVVLNTK
ncbi:MAG TPA: 50S ribosomal protein L22 [Candidatus Absconditabacterales bacterium]|nr:50S ribosomal protein L22 [Candidatus Absconditabacterales bacterium]HOQ79084.1 50S ribosomal protein L22 [Candidatus Absconditabacterales bacterium]HPK27627.1 50S ribosomal protein L22 [Candidatus Absconditabacterales bacterium]